MSLKVPSAEGCGDAAGWTGLKGFQGLDGQWKGLLSFAGEADGLDAVVSSSDDSFLGLGFKGGFEGDAAEGTAYRKFLSGDQPGGRRLMNV